jgi:hypothetical protein
MSLRPPAHALAVAPTEPDATGPQGPCNPDGERRERPGSRSSARLGDAVRADWGRATRAEIRPSRGGDVIQNIERTIPTAEVDRSDLPV